MRVIILLEGESIPATKGSLASIAAADLVIDCDGVVVKSNGPSVDRVNVRELLRVLETKARGPRVVSGPGGDECPAA